MEISGANVTVMVSDLDRAVAFYTEVLGLTLKNRFGNHWADIEGAGISIGLHPSDRAITPADNMQIGLKVKNFESAVKELAQKGIECEVNNEAWGSLALFKDPDQNALYLSQQH